MTAQRYLQYLPDFVAEYVEFQKLGEIEGEVLEEESKAKQEMEQDQESLGELYGDENIDIID